jgi:nitrogen regulatory protein PII-like uncharacterized protein
MTIGTLFANPKSRAIVTKHAGGFLLMEDMSMAIDMTLDQVAINHPTFVSQELLAKIEKELAEIK